MRPIRPEVRRDPMSRTLLLSAALAGLLMSPAAEAQCWGAGGPPSSTGGSDGSGASGSGSSSGGASTSTGSGGASTGNTRAGITGARTGARRPDASAPTAAGMSQGVRGIRGGSGRTAATTGSCGDASRGLVGRDLTSWSAWWARNQDAFLWDAAPALTARPSMTASGRDLTGRGRKDDGSLRPPRSMVYTAIVPALLETVETSDDPRVVDAAVRALGPMVEAPFQDPVAEALLPLFAHPSDEVRLSAALSLGLLGAEGSRTLLDLATCSNDGHALVGESSVPPWLRAAATLGLGYADDPASVAALIDMLERLPDSEAATKRCAIHAMGLMRNPRTRLAGDYLVARLQDERMEPTIRSAIPTALARHGRVDAVGTMLDVLTDRDTDRRVRQSVVIGLGKLATMEHADVLEELLDRAEDDKDEATRHFAVMALAEIGARDGSPAEHADAHDALSKFLGKALGKPRRGLDRPWAALAVGVYVRGRPERRASFADRLEDAYDDVKDPALRGAFALGLGLAGVSRAAETVLDDFRRTGDEDLRGTLALALGFLGDPEALSVLAEEVGRKGTGAAYRRNVGLACRLLGDRDAPGVLAGHLAGEASLDGRIGLSRALGECQHRDAVEPLARAAADEALDSASRASATEALGRVAEPTGAPWHASLRVGSNYLADAGPELDALLGVN